jgi:hypothetical protein
MAATSLSKPVRAKVLAATPASTDSEEWPDGTRVRLFAYLLSIKPLDAELCPGIQARYDRGSNLVRKLALSAVGTSPPRLKLSADQAADILTFMHCSEAVEPATWWLDKGTVSHVCGFVTVLEAIEATLRRRSRS